MFADEDFKTLYIHIMEYYVATEEKEVRPFATTWMDSEAIILSEIDSSDRES